MLNFKHFLLEEAKQIKHITHVEDHPLQKGAAGFKTSFNSLLKAHEHIKNGGHSSELTTKYDGSPAIVYGHHPKTGQFFVASKSAFNVNPKINYTHADIQANHGHAPGLADKLHAALTHLKKITPKTGVYQGDLLFTHNDIHHDNGSVSFHPNPYGLTYKAHGDEADKIKKSKIGLVTHLKYGGSDIHDLSAHHEVDHHNFKKNSDVYTVDPRYDTTKTRYTPHEQSEFEKHLTSARKLHDDHGHEIYTGTEKHGGAGGHLETYINHTVKTDEKPNVDGFKEHLKRVFTKSMDKVKTEKAKSEKRNELGQHLAHVDDHKNAYDKLFKMHNHLQKAKNVLVNVMNRHQDFEHTHNGEAANPEGYVIHDDHGETSKLINRAEFSKRNLLGIRK